MRVSPISAWLLICAAGIAWPASGEEASSAGDARRGAALINAAAATAWLAPIGSPVPDALPGRVVQAQQTGAAAGPNIGTVGIGVVAGLSDFEIGPSIRYWINERFGFQAHLGFSGDDLPGDDLEYVRFEPTFIVAIGDFGDGAVNVRPYAGGGLRVVRTDRGDFNDTDVKPAGVGGVEFGFRDVRRLEASVEVSLSDSSDFDDGPLSGPDFGGARLAALVHYFFD